jgi:hypothetical protein
VVSLTGGNRNDVTQLLPLLDSIPPVRGRRGRPRCRPDGLYADRAYDHEKYREVVRGKGIRPHIARRGQAHGSGLGTIRSVVERSIAWYHGMKRLRIRWERRDDIHEAFLALATCIITYRHVNDSVRTSASICGSPRPTSPPSSRPVQPHRPAGISPPGRPHPQPPRLVITGRAKRSCTPH